MINSDIDKRKPVWAALSEFYLDTELMDEDHKRIAQVFRNSGFDLQAIKDMDTYEVFPLLQPNLLSVAGEWGMFDQEWLFSECQKNFKKRNSWFYQIKTKFYNNRFYWMRKDHWDKIELLSK